MAVLTKDSVAYRYTMRTDKPRIPMRAYLRAQQASHFLNDGRLAYELGAALRERFAGEG